MPKKLFYQSIRYICFIVLSLFYILQVNTGSSFAAVNESNTQQTKVATDSSLTDMWQFRAEQLAIITQKTSELKGEMKGIKTFITNTVKETRAEMRRLQSLYQVSTSNPSEQTNILEQLVGLKTRFNQSVDPMTHVETSLSQWKESLSKQEKEIADLFNESKNATAMLDISFNDSEYAKAHKSKLTAARKELDSLSQTVSEMSSSIKFINSRFGDIIPEYTQEMDGVWKRYYTTSTETTNRKVFNSGEELDTWQVAIESQLATAFPHVEENITIALKNGAIACAIFIILALLAHRGANRLPSLWKSACKKIFTIPWIWVTIGVALVAASRNQYGAQYIGLTIPGALLLLWGICSFSWALRVAAVPSLEGAPSPLHRLYLPSALGILLLAFNAPVRTMSIAWAIILVVCILLLVKVSKKESSESLALLERMFYKFSFYFCIASLAVTIAGFGRLAVLVLLFIFALFNIVTLAKSLTSLFNAISNSMFDANERPISNALANALPVPFACIASLVCTVPWMWAVPGASSVLHQALKINYSYGGASFDFSRLLFIILLFYFFRSFNALAKTTLAQLPEKLPHIQKGVIPPVQKIVSYLVWVIFALLALSMLGVDFTSLAVVAGGLSVGIGFGMQNLFNNLISGIMLIFGQTVLVGDHVQIGGTDGMVKEINIRSTSIEKEDGSLVYVPNASIMTGEVTNLTRNDRSGETSITVTVPGQTDLDKISSLFETASLSNEYVKRTPAITVNKKDEKSAAEVTVSLRVEDASKISLVVEELKKSFDTIIQNNVVVAE